MSELSFKWPRCHVKTTQSSLPHYYCVDYNGVVRNNWAGFGVVGNHRTMPQVTGDPWGQPGFFFPLTLSEFSWRQRAAKSRKCLVWHVSCFQLSPKSPFMTSPTLPISSGWASTKSHLTHCISWMSKCKGKNERPLQIVVSWQPSQDTVFMSLQYSLFLVDEPWTFILIQWEYTNFARILHSNSSVKQRISSTVYKA